MDVKPLALEGASPDSNRSPVARRGPGGRGHARASLPTPFPAAGLLAGRLSGRDRLHRLPLPDWCPFAIVSHKTGRRWG